MRNECELEIKRKEGALVIFIAFCKSRKFNLWYKLQKLENLWYSLKQVMGNRNWQEATTLCHFLLVLSLSSRRTLCHFLLYLFTLTIQRVHMTLLQILESTVVRCYNNSVMYFL